MLDTKISLAGATLCVLVPLATAQDEMPMPQPALELKKFEPLIGNWTGSGVFHDPAAGQTKWTAHGSYKWSHDTFWVQEDFTISFEGMPASMAIRAYLGWDAEQQRYVNAHIGNNGDVGLHEMHWQDGAMTMLMTRKAPDGVPYCERAVTKVDGDKMTMNIDFLMTAGPSMLVVKGSFTRTDKAAPGVMGAGAFGAEPNESMAKLARGAGVYDVKGSMVYMPGVPAMNIHGTDTYKMIFGGTVMHGNTKGGSDAMPGDYIADVFWAWDKESNCFSSVFVSNMGESGTMEMRYSPDGKQLISTGTATRQGTPMLQRFVLHTDASGGWSKGVGHSIMGGLEPVESFNAVYKKK